MALSMREMELQRAERARGPRSGGKSMVEEISLATDRGDCLTARGGQRAPTQQRGALDDERIRLRTQRAL